MSDTPITWRRSGDRERAVLVEAMEGSDIRVRDPHAELEQAQQALAEALAQPTEQSDETTPDREELTGEAPAPPTEETPEDV